jgi:hypothetical protein
MKRRKLIIMVLIPLIMIISSIFLLPDIKEFFWGGSNYVFADFVVLNGMYPFIFTSILLLILLISKKFNQLLLSVFLIIFVVWILSGRTIALKVMDNNCEIITGWFYVGTNFLNTQTAIKYKKIDEESELKFNYLILWRLEIKKGKFEEIIFIGPFLWSDMKHQLEQAE